MSEHQSREKFATQMDSAMLADLRKLARAEGRQLQSLIEEAVGNLLDQRKRGKARPHAMQAYRASVEQFQPLYEKLAK